MSIFTQGFKSATLPFLKSHPIIVPGTTDTAIAALIERDPLAPRIFHFQLRKHAPSKAFELVPLGEPFVSDTSTPSIRAYYLGWERGLAPHLDLGEDASFFFTSHLTNCRMTVTGLPGLKPRVSHVAGARPAEGASTGVSTRADRDRYEAAGPFPGEAIVRARSYSISDSTEKKPFAGNKYMAPRPGFPKIHGYGGGSVSSSFFVGIRGVRTWEFWAQTTEGDRSDETKNASKITILECRNFMDISRERALKR